jgi:chromosome segregation ATPase
MAATMEAQKQMEAAKKEADEKSDNAKQRHQEANTEIVSKMEEFKRAILAGQQKAQELTAEMAKLNEEYQTLLEVCENWIKMKNFN